MENEKRLIATGVRVPDDATLETVDAWVERARRLAAYVMKTCPPDMPPITIEVSPLGRPAARDRSFP